MEANTEVWILGTLLVTLLAGIIGRYMGTSNKVTETSCSERRDKYNELILAKFKSVEDRLDLMTTMLQVLTNAQVVDNKK